MRKAGYGRIVNVASIAGKEGGPGISAYAAAKAGVIGFTKSLARELVDSGVLVNAIASTSPARLAHLRSFVLRFKPARRGFRNRERKELVLRVDAGELVRHVAEVLHPAELGHPRDLPLGNGTRHRGVARHHVFHRHLALRQSASRATDPILEIRLESREIEQRRGRIPTFSLNGAEKRVDDCPDSALVRWLRRHWARHTECDERHYDGKTNTRHARFENAHSNLPAIVIKVTNARQPSS